VLPLARQIGDWSITIEGRPYVREENPNGDFQWVTPGYFQTMGITRLRGRLLSEHDREGAALVAVINDTMADRYWPGGDVLGRRFHMGGPDSTNPKLTIVGIVGTTRHNAVTEAPRAEMYLPHAQLPESIGGPARAMALVAKTTADPLAIAPQIREVVWSLDRSLPVSDIRTMEQVTASALGTTRFASLWLGVFAALALALAAVGTYGTISLLVAERSKEIGIRMALGARRASITRLVLAEGLVLGIAGVGLGLAGAFAVTRLLSSLVYGVDTLDPVTFTTVPLVVMIVALLACVPPARKAGSVDPVVTLRAG
jgi:putative ABC transport system permease protein